MGSIFESDKEITINVAADQQVVVNALQSHVQKDGVLARLSKAYSVKGAFVGSVDGQSAEIRYIWSVRNSLEPTMHVTFHPSPAGGCTLHARFKVLMFPKIFMTVWLAVACLVCVVALREPSSDAQLFAVCFPLFGVRLLVLMRRFAKHNENKLEQLLRDIKRSLETGNTNANRLVD